MGFRGSKLYRYVFVLIYSICFVIVSFSSHLLSMPREGYRGWLDEAMVSCILRHRGVQQILAYSWARHAILAAGKGRGGCFYFFCFFTIIHFPPSPLSFSLMSSTISSFFLLPFSERRHKMTHKGWRVVKPQHNRSINREGCVSWLCHFLGIIIYLWRLKLELEGYTLPFAQNFICITPVGQCHIYYPTSPRTLT